MNIGEEMGVAPGDVVGAILGETGLPAAVVGTVDIRERHLFVDVAANEILTDSRARSDSRISLVTGIHRKEIRRWRDLPAWGTRPVPPSLDRSRQRCLEWRGRGTSKAKNW